MMLNASRIEWELAGKPKASLPKLSLVERNHAKKLLESRADDLDPVAALRLALILRKPIPANWLTADVIDMALPTGEISKRFMILAESSLVVSGLSLIEVLGRRSATSPLPIFRMIYRLTVPGKRKPLKQTKVSFDALTSVSILELALKLIPLLLSGKARKSSRAIPSQMLEIASATALNHRTTDLAISAVRFIARLERDVGWQALEGAATTEMLASLAALPASLSAHLLRTGEVSELSRLREAVRQHREAETLFLAAVSQTADSESTHLPMGSRTWSAGLTAGETEARDRLDESPPTSDASFERLALLLINSWDARDDGERSAYAFKLTQEVLRNGFGLYLMGNLEELYCFNPAVHESVSSIRGDELVRLTRPWVERRSPTEIQILIKGLAEVADDGGTNAG